MTHTGATTEPQSNGQTYRKSIKNNQMVGPEGFDRAGAPAAAADRPNAARFDLPIVRRSSRPKLTR